MRDDKVREEHAALDGLEFPVDHPFWLTYMPPNGWNCRCGVEQLLPSEYHGNEQPRLADIPLQIPPEFQNNPGITNQFLYQKMLNLPVTDWAQALDHQWDSYPKEALPALINTANLTPDELLNLCKKYLGNRFIYDVNSVPIVLSETKAEKMFLQGKPLSDIANRFRYLNSIEDTIKNPHEAWLDPESKRIYYLKRYANNIAVLVDIEADNQIRYFNIMFQHHKELDNDKNIKMRKGILLFNK